MSTTTIKRMRFEATETSGSVAAILNRPQDATLLFVLAHGAGAGMEHPFMERIAAALAEQRIATFRYQFPYMEAGRKMPDRPATLQGTVRTAVREAVRQASRKAGGLPIIAGGKSMGGRMTSAAQAAEPLPGVEGLVFLGFPLHPAKKPDDTRATHLADVDLPMLFLQGTRDALADLTLLRPVCQNLGSRATLHVVEGGDHSFDVLKRSGRTDGEVIRELAKTIATWARRLP